MERSWKLSRRTFLRGAGTCLALPLLDAMIPTATARVAAQRNRMVFVYVPNGVNIFDWKPAGKGRKWELSKTLTPLAPLKDHVSVLTGLSHPLFTGNGHEGCDSWLTGANLHGTAGFDYKNSVSVDQVAATALAPHTRFPSLELSTRGGSGIPGLTHTLAFSWSGVPLAAENQPRLAFERLFVDDTGDTRKAKERRFTDDRSILDAVRDQAAALNRRLGRRDREKLDEYATSVREVERRVKRAEEWMDVPKPKVDSKGLKLDARPHDKQRQSPYYRVMYDLMFLALQTDTTRVLTFQLEREGGGGGGLYTELGLKSIQHKYSHHGGEPDKLEALSKIDRFHVGNLAYFLNRLKSTREGDRTLLDRTVTMYGCGMNSGDRGGHSSKDLSLLVAGGRGLGLKQGQLLDFPGDKTPLSNLFVTMLNGIGIPTKSFQDSTGPLAGLA